MRVVVFPYKPPPHHGQSYMVQLMLEGFVDKRHDVECFHVNARFSSTAVDGGRFRFEKVFRLPWYLLKTIWLRLSKGASTLYFVPTPPQPVTLYRDWIVLLTIRPFFKRTIFHWHATGLGEWLKTLPPWKQRLSKLALGNADLSISLTHFNEKDAAPFTPRRTIVVPNGIPDPCPNFEVVKENRRRRLEKRLNSAEPQIVRVLFLALCIPEKGLFDAIRGVALANKRGNSFEFHLTIGGELADAKIREDFDALLKELGNPATIRHVGFLKGAEKQRALAEADIFCFPTYYGAENQPLSVIEAMAFGLPVITTRWRAVPELLPKDYPGIVDIKSPDQIATALLNLATRDDAEAFRKRFVGSYTIEAHVEALAKAFHETAGA
jgi:glycosyltransferase involved in cell wall biosynthesis